MANNFAQIGGSFEALITRLNTALNEPQPSPALVYDRFCYVDNSGVGKAGSEIAQYPIRVTGQRPKTKGDKEQRDFAEPIVWSITCGSKRQDIWAEEYPVSESRDPYGLFKSDAPDALGSAAIFWQELIAEMVNTNGNCLDGQPFFGSHKANPAVVNSADFSNDLAGATELDEDGVIAAFDALTRIPAGNGQLANTSLTSPYILCPTQKLYRKALKLQQDGALLAKVFGANTAAAAESSSLQGEFEVILMPQLYNPAVAATGKRWYAGNRQGSKRRPFLVRNTARPRFEMDLSKKGSNNMVQVYMWAEGDVAFALPQTIVRATTA